MEIKTVTMAVKADMKDYIKGFIDVPRFDSMCRECRGHGRTWACPPYAFDPMEVWNAYSTILLYAKKTILPAEETEILHAPDELSKAYMRLLYPVKTALMNELLCLERNTPNSLALFAGGCDICTECARGRGEPCIHPEKMRYSVESLGGDVIKSVTELFDERVLWAENGRLPEHFILMGALLEK